MSAPLRGTGVAPGVAVGRLVLAHADPADGAVPPPADVAGVLDAVAERMDGLAAALRIRGRTEEADIAEFAAMLARDRELRGHAEDLAAGGAEPAQALRGAVASYAAMLEGIDDLLIAERAVDVRDIGRQAEALLRGEQLTVSHDPGGGPVVLAGRELAAVDLLRAEALAGAVSERGGPTGHLAIVARSLGIPLVLGVAVGDLTPLLGTEVLVDGGSGAIGGDIGAVPPPRQAPGVPGGGAGQAITREGRRIRVRANVGTAAEALAAGAHGAEGVGLLRTELPFLADTADWPGEERHLRMLAPILAAVPPGPVVVRTLDFTGDRRPPFLRGRGISVPGPQALTAQLRGILRAAAGTGVEVSILLPMVDHPRRIKHARGLIADACADLGLPPPPLGAMVELPQVLDRIDDLAEHADFLSLGTNDLTARLLGLGRDDPRLTPASAAHPDVLAAIAHTIRSGHAYGRAVSACGDAAADPAVLPHLVRLGCDAVSVEPSALARVRATIRAQ